MRSFITTLLTGFLVIASAHAFPTVALITRGASALAIVSPASDTVWGLGKQAAVSWDASKVSKGADPLASLELFSTESAASVAQLATNFDPAKGTVSFPVPQVAPGSYIVKIGDSASAEFQIVVNAVTYLPDISSPTIDTTWTVGKKATITWDKSSIPANAAPLPYLDLFTEAFGGSPLFVARLASNIDVYSASVTITVPEVRAGSSYLVMLGGYGHSSPHFTITV